MTKSEFITDLDCKNIDDTKWELLSTLQYRSQRLGRVVAVPAGFVTDFASVPRVPVVYTAFGNRAHRESVVHDYLYQTHLVTKATADRIFFEAMGARGKKWWIRLAMYMGVVVAGHNSYNSGPRRYTVMNIERRHE